MRKPVSALQPGDTFLWRNSVAVVHDIVKVPSTVSDIWSIKLEVPGRRWRGAVQVRGREVVEVLLEGRRGGKRNAPRRNPTIDVAESLRRDYERFHGRAPNTVREFKGWYPGGLVQIGRGVDIGYNVTRELPSKKEGFYVHDFGAGVKIYKRAPARSRADLFYHNFPVDELQVLGRGLGFTYEDDTGKHEVKGSRDSYLATTPDRRTLVFVDSSGVKYLAKGGRMRVEDWIYD